MKMGLRHGSCLCILLSFLKQIMKNISTSTRSQNQGFSLVEMLMTIAIIGVMTAMALPTFGSTEPAKQSVHKQNAQNFCSLAIAISSAGVDLTGNVNFANPGSDEVKAVLSNLVQGVTITNGTLAGSNFKLPHLDAAHIDGAAKFVSIKNGELMYNGALNP